MSTTDLQVNLPAILEEAFLALSEKEREVISKRFALAGGQRNTLETIGQSFGVTRERIRQIESTALQKLRRVIGSTKCKQVNEIAKQIIRQQGGVMLEESLISAVLNLIHSASDIDGNIIRLSLAIDEQVIKQDRTHQFKPFWREQTIALDDIKLVIATAQRLLQKQQDIIATEELSNLVRAQLANKNKAVKAEMVGSCLHLDHDLKAVDAGWGLMSWRHINPRSIRDKALVIMREVQKPMHFVEIANAIGDYGFDKKVVTVQAVHNELIRDEHFVLIGRGLYALNEWGYSEGTVADIIENLLKKNAAPMSKDEIIQGVLNQRQVKKGTISLNLQKCPWFVRVGRAVYDLDLAKKKIDTSKRRRRG